MEENLWIIKAKQSVGMKYLRTDEGCIKRDHIHYEDFREKLKYSTK
jgi:hypothetical protein